MNRIAANARLRACVGTVLLVCVAVSCGGSSTVRLHGSIAYALSPVTPPDTCGQDGPLGTEPLEIRAEGGRTVARGSTGPARSTGRRGMNDGLGSVVCFYREDFSVTVPKAPAYSVVLGAGSRHAGPVTFDRLQADGFVWNLSFPLGNP